VASPKEKTDGSSISEPDKEYEPVDCKGSGKAQCDALNDWGAAWKAWAEMLLKEKNEMKLAICRLEQKVYYGAAINTGMICDAKGVIVAGSGNPPTDTTQPPKPPFK
jgi:hypothetical protein